MITITVPLNGRNHTVIGGLTWVNLSTIDAAPGVRKPTRTEPLQKKPLRALKRVMQSRRVSTGVLIQDAAEPANWMFGYLAKPPREATSAIVWMAIANPTERVLYIEQQESGPTWIAATDLGKLGIAPEVDSLINSDQALRAAIDTLLEHWTSEDVPFKVVLNLRHRITTPLLERAIQNGQATPGTLSDLLTAPPPPAARLQRLLPLPLANALVIAAAVGVVGYYALDWYQTSRAEQEALAEAQRQQLEAAGVDLDQDRLKQLDETAQQAAVLAALREDTETPVAQDVVTACANLVADIQDIETGWALTEVSCDPITQNASATYRLTLGSQYNGGSNRTLDVLKERAAVVHYTDYERATASFPLPTLTKRSALNRDGLIHSKDWVEQMGQRLQELRMADPTLAASFGAPEVRSVSYQVPVDPTVEQTAGPKFAEVSPQFGYQHGSILLSGAGPIMLIHSSLVEPNISLRKITITPTNQDWAWNLELNYVCVS
ncbi:hypothetical protein C7S18_20320 [Ahniella affigens]|uniref:Uncharacterized protein n=1 Tax=Ahniella affigens TaxID=2021234 RepID=A0A2P1PX03_9GAMM|nr:type 4b pilus protein PilO2 [Ahniella affigens]AVP99373.1 hypothetical protein C7S18_20320 [Ahniella affigens]